MKTLILTFFLALTCSIGFAQVFRIDSLPEQGILLDKGWKFHAGDNPDWAKADFDDSKWKSIDPTKDIMDLPQVRKAESGYLRFHFQIDSALIGRALSLKISQTIASEIYLNGRLIHQFGQVNSESDKEQIYYLINHPVSIVFKKSGNQVLTIRFSFTKSNKLLKYKPTKYTTFKAVLVETDKAVNTYVSKNIFDVQLSYYKLGIVLFLFLLHFLLYLTYPQQKANLFISLYAFCWCFFYYADTKVNTLPINGEQLYFFNHLIKIISLLLALFFLLALYSYFKEAKHFLFWILIFLIAIAYPIGVYFVNLYIFYNSFGIPGILAFESFRVAFKNFNQNRLGAKFLIAGLVFYIIFMGLFFMSVFGLIHISTLSAQIYLNLALLSIPICYSLLLAVDTGQTNRLLQQKLTEVETLSTEKQQILTTQNETLERQVTERTAELNQSLADLRATQSQLIQSEKMASLGELTAGIAHEIQNPLNFVNNFSEVNTELIDELEQEINKGNLEEVKLLAKDIKENEQKINHHGKRAGDIVKGMLQHSRSSIGVKEPTNINALADEYLRLAYHGLRAKDKSFNVELITDFDETIGNINIIPQDIGRVILNLITNAFYVVNEKAKAESRKQNAEEKSYEPTVSITTKHSPLPGRGAGGEVLISVKDNGNGIPQKIVDKIFQPFFTTKPTGQGIGLGLSLSYDIVKAHGGEININTKEGEGAEFTIQLPV